MVSDRRPRRHRDSCRPPVGRVTVGVEDYDLPGLTTEDGIADVGFACMAWIIDPGKNALATVQLKP
jgi:hypothetical protein